MLLSLKYASNVLNTMLLQMNSNLGYMSAAIALAKSQDPSSSFTEGDSKGKKYVLCSLNSKSIILVNFRELFYFIFICTIYINNYLFLVSMLHVSMFIRHLQ